MTALFGALPGVGLGWSLSIALHGSFLVCAGVFAARPGSEGASGIAGNEPDMHLSLDLRVSSFAGQVDGAPPAEDPTPALQESPSLESEPSLTQPGEFPPLVQEAPLQPDTQQIDAAMPVQEVATAREDSGMSPSVAESAVLEAESAATSPPVREHALGKDPAAGTATSRAQKPTAAASPADSTEGAPRMGKPAGTPAVAAPAGASGRQRGETRAATVSNEQRIEYPAISRRLGEQGRVVCRLSVRADGSVSAVTILRSSGHARLDEAARRGLLGWRCRPAVVDGVAVDADLEHTITFRLVRE